MVRRRGGRVRAGYFVAEQDPEKTKAIIGAMMAPNEKVEYFGRFGVQLSSNDVAVCPGLKKAK